MVGDAQDLLDRMVDDEDRDPPAAFMPARTARSSVDLLRGRGRRTARPARSSWRPRPGRGRCRPPFGHAERERVRVGVGVRVAAPGRRGCGRPPPRRRRPGRQGGGGAAACGHRQHVADRQVAEQLGVLEGAADAEAPAAPAGWSSAQVAPAEAEARRTHGGPHEAAEDVDERGLAGAVGADQPDGLAGRHVQRHAAGGPAARRRRPTGSADGGCGRSQAGIRSRASPLDGRAGGGVSRIGSAGGPRRRQARPGARGRGPAAAAGARRS